MTRAWMRQCGCFCALLLVVGCRINKDDIDTWEGTVKGPGKIVSVLKSERYQTELRAHAALALVTMDRQDVDGVVELGETLSDMEGASRGSVLQLLIPKLVKRLEEGHTRIVNETEAQAAARAQQIRAKDAAYLIVDETQGESRQALINAVVGWYAADFNGRSLAGNYSAEQVIKRFGTDAAMRFVEAMKPKMPAQALAKAAELISQVGDAKAKQQAAAKLVAIQKEMEGAAFTKWMRDRIKKQMAAGGGKVDLERLKAAVALNRASYIIDGAITAMKPLSDIEPIKGHLSAIAFEPATTKAGREKQEAALSALAGRLDTSASKPLLAIALNDKAAPTLRDLAFDRLADIQAPDAIEALWPLVASKEQPRVRWRACEIVLASGGTKVVKAFFDKLPEPEEAGYSADELEMYATRLAQLSPPPIATAVAELRASTWPHRVIALRLLARKGTLDHEKKMQRLTGDKGKPSGRYWPKDLTLGDIAKDAITELKQRLKA